MTSDVPQTNSFEMNTLLHTRTHTYIYIYKTTLVQFSRRSITEKYRVPPVLHRPTTRQLRRAGRDIWTVSWKISWELITEIRDRASGVVGADSLSLFRWLPYNDHRVILVGPLGGKRGREEWFGERKVRRTCYYNKRNFVTCQTR